MLFLFVSGMREDEGFHWSSSRNWHDIPSGGLTCLFLPALYAAWYKVREEVAG